MVLTSPSRFDGLLRPRAAGYAGSHEDAHVDARRRPRRVSKPAGADGHGRRVRAGASRLKGRLTMAQERGPGMGRRGFLGAAGSLAAATLVSGTKSRAEGQTTAASNVPQVSRRRKLGRLEVSSVGLGVQNVSRKYETTVPHRPEMINIIRTAFDRGVTFFDTAEAYGPHEAERILGEAIAPFRNRVVITSKFGWNIDQETGERRPGLNSRPEPHQGRRRRHVETAADRSHRSALPTSRRP